LTLTAKGGKGSTSAASASARRHVRFELPILDTDGIPPQLDTITSTSSVQYFIHLYGYDIGHVKIKRIDGDVEAPPLVGAGNVVAAVVARGGLVVEVAGVPPTSTSPPPHLQPSVSAPPLAGSTTTIPIAGIGNRSRSPPVLPPRRGEEMELDLDARMTLASIGASYSEQLIDALLEIHRSFVPFIPTKSTRRQPVSASSPSSVPQPPVVVVPSRWVRTAIAARVDARHLQFIAIAPWSVSSPSSSLPSTTMTPKATKQVSLDFHGGSFVINHRPPPIITLPPLLVGIGASIPSRGNSNNNSAPSSIPNSPILLPAVGPVDVTILPSVSLPSSRVPPSFSLNHPIDISVHSTTATSSPPRATRSPPPVSPSHATGTPAATTSAHPSIRCSLHKGSLSMANIRDDGSHDVIMGTSSSTDLISFGSMVIGHKVTRHGPRTLAHIDSLCVGFTLPRYMAIILLEASVMRSIQRLTSAIIPAPPSPRSSPASSASPAFMTPERARSPPIISSPSPSWTSPNGFARSSTNAQRHHPPHKVVVTIGNVDVEAEFVDYSRPLTNDDHTAAVVFSTTNLVLKSYPSAPASVINALGQTPSSSTTASSPFLSPSFMSTSNPTTNSSPPNSSNNNNNSGPLPSLPTTPTSSSSSPPPDNSIPISPSVVMSPSALPTKPRHLLSCDAGHLSVIHRSPSAPPTKLVIWNSLRAVPAMAPYGLPDVQLFFDDATVTIQDKYMFGDIVEDILVRWKAFKIWKAQHVSSASSPKVQSPTPLPTSPTDPSAVPSSSPTGNRNIRPFIGLDVGHLGVHIKHLSVAFEDDALSITNSLHRWLSLHQRDRVRETLARKQYIYKATPQQRHRMELERQRQRRKQQRSAAQSSNASGSYSTINGESKETKREGSPPPSSSLPTTIETLHDEDGLVTNQENSGDESSEGEQEEESEEKEEAKWRMEVEVELWQREQKMVQDELEREMILQREAAAEQSAQAAAIINAAMDGPISPRGSETLADAVAAATAAHPRRGGLSLQLPISPTFASSSSSLSLASPGSPPPFLHLPAISPPPPVSPRSVGGVSTLAVPSAFGSFAVSAATTGTSLPPPSPRNAGGMGIAPVIPPRPVVTSASATSLHHLRVPSSSTTIPSVPAQISPLFGSNSLSGLGAGSGQIGGSSSNSGISGQSPATTPHTMLSRIFNVGAGAASSVTSDTLYAQRPTYERIHMERGRFTNLCVMEVHAFHFVLNTQPHLMQPQSLINTVRSLDTCSQPPYVPSTTPRPAATTGATTSSVPASAASPSRVAFAEPSVDAVDATHPIPSGLSSIPSSLSTEFKRTDVPSSPLLSPNNDNHVDDESDTASKNFVELWGRRLVVSGHRMTMRLRDYPIPLLRAWDIKLDGPFILGQLGCPHRFLHSIDVALTPPTPSAVSSSSSSSSSLSMTTVPRGGAVPMKVYHDLTLTLKRADLCYGPSIQPALQSLSAVTSRLSSTNPERVGGPLQWWDDMRYKVHGNFHINSESTTMRTLATVSPYDTSCIESTATWLALSMVKRRWTLDADQFAMTIVNDPKHRHGGAAASRGLGGTINDTVSSMMNADEQQCLHSDGRLLLIPHLEARVDFKWKCKNDRAPDQHYVHHSYWLSPRYNQMTTVEEMNDVDWMEPFRAISLRLSLRIAMAPAQITTAPPASTGGSSTLPTIPSSGPSLGETSSSCGPSPTSKHNGPYATIRHAALSWLSCMQDLQTSPPSYLTKPVLRFLSNGTLNRQPLHQAPSLEFPSGVGELLTSIKLAHSMQSPRVELLHQ
jgi:hypothetical protein